MAGGEARRRAERRGRFGEAAAALYLLAKGYRIVARRFRAGVGEVDIIARRGRVLAFVEVKTRADRRDGLEAVGARSRARIADAARAWTARRPDDAGLSLRFDVVVVVPWRWPLHIADAFRSD